MAGQALISHLQECVSLEDIVVVININNLTILFRASNGQLFFSN